MSWLAGHLQTPYQSCNPSIKRVLDLFSQSNDSFADILAIKSEHNRNFQLKMPNQAIRFNL